MFRILHFLTVGFLFFILFSFSHIFYIFGGNSILEIYGRGGYEGIKSTIVGFFGMLYLLWVVIYIIKYKVYKQDKRFLNYIYLIFIGILISTLFSINILGSTIGLSEKYHGAIFFTSLLSFFIALYFGYEKQDFKRLLNYIFIFSIPIYIYGVIQYFGYDPLRELYISRVPTFRSSSFFGNANYLAGYILILLPLIKLINLKLIRNFMLILSFLVLFMTGSYFGIFLGFIYVLYLLFSYNKQIFGFVFVLFIILSAFVFNSLSIEKHGSLLARPFIWYTSTIIITDSPKSLLIGNGADTLQLVFDDYKVEELSKYETSTYTADRTHNLFLDLIYFFGLFGGGIISFFIIKSLFIGRNKEVKLSILFGLLFFSFNVAISIHYILLLILIAGVYNKKI